MRIDCGATCRWIPIYFDSNFEPYEYSVFVGDTKIGGAILQPESLLALKPDEVTLTGVVIGTPMIEPAFGLEGLWISKTQEEEAASYGYTVVSSISVIKTHFHALLRIHALKFKKTCCA